MSTVPLGWLSRILRNSSAGGGIVLRDRQAQTRRERFGGLDGALVVGRVDGGDADAVEHPGQQLRPLFASRRQRRIRRLVQPLGVTNQDDGALRAHLGRREQPSAARRTVRRRVVMRTSTRQKRQSTAQT